MKIGIDFDNTIVCYDESFYELAQESYTLPSSVRRTKEDVKDYLKANGQDELWTYLQGVAYGPKMEKAKTFPGFIEFLDWAKQMSHEIFIVSHRSRAPYSGDKFDLHKCALDWLSNQAWVGNQGVGFSNIYFKETRSDKISKIRELEVEVFIDDLLEVLMDPRFPVQTGKFLFSGQLPKGEKVSIKRIQDWFAAIDLIGNRE